jgi:hypothetical protein
LVACSTWKTFEKYRNIRISPWVSHWNTGNRLTNQ